MQQYYQPLYDKARNLQFRVHDVMDDSNHPMAQTLSNEVRQLTDDLHQQKNPHDIENRIRVIQNSLMQAQHSNVNYMNSEHSSGLYHDYENMRMDVRKMPHY